MKWLIKLVDTIHASLHWKTAKTVGVWECQYNTVTGNRRVVRIVDDVSFTSPYPSKWVSMGLTDEDIPTRENSINFLFH